jgi:uncharacterized protein YjiS (DUF1127 family)
MKPLPFTTAGMQAGIARRDGMSRTCKGSHRPLLRATTRSAAATCPRAVARLRRLVLDRAVEKAMRSLESHPPLHAWLLRDIGLTPADAERLASALYVLAADPFHIAVKPNIRPTKSKSRSR